MKISIKYIILTLGLLGCAFVFGQSDESAGNSQQVFRHPLTDMPGPSDDVVTSHYFPSHADQKLPIGETVSILCHFANDGTTPLNITAIMGSLNSPHDFNFHIQNFSYQPFGIVVKGGEEITLEYKIQVHSMLEPVDFTLASTVFYESEDQGFSSTFFNQTVELYLPISDWDVGTLIQVFTAIVSTVLVGVMVYYGCSDNKPLPLISTKKQEQDDYDSPARRTRGKKNKSH